MPNIGPVELIIILVIALIVIGPGRLPDVGAALGKSIREFRKASTDITDAARVDVAPQAAAPAGPSPAASRPGRSVARGPGCADRGSHRGYCHSGGSRGSGRRGARDGGPHLGCP